MNRNKNRHLSSLFLSIVFTFGWVSISYAQEPKLVEFDSTSHNYGTIEEAKTPKADHTFKFKNISSGPIVILDAKASCGCTTPGWAKEIIRLAGEGYVMASYDTKNRPGPFDKSITVRVAKVFLDTQKADTTTVQTIVLRIKGDVKPKPKTPLDVYRYEDGNLRFTTNNFSFGNISKKGIQERNVTIYNAGKKAVTIKKVESKPAISVRFQDNKVVIAPKDSLKATVLYHLDAVDDYEWQSERIIIHTDDDTSAQKRWYVNAIVLPDFSHLNMADSAKFPKMVIDPPTLDFGVINEGEQGKATFTIKNTGKSPLDILKTKASCACTVFDLPKKQIAPGEKIEVKVTFDGKDKKGDQFKTLKVISNDPKNSYITIGLQAKIKEKENNDNKK